MRAKTLNTKTGLPNALREAARGLKAGELLLTATIERALSLGADPLYLLTNSRCAAAIRALASADMVRFLGPG